MLFIFSFPQTDSGVHGRHADGRSVEQMAAQHVRVRTGEQQSYQLRQVLVEERALHKQLVPQK